MVNRRGFSMDNLPELRDIHLPADGVSPWPLAAGWWYLLAVAAALAAAVKFYLWFSKNSKKIYARYLLNKKAAENTAAAAAQMSELLRRICISRYPEAVSYSGQKWVDFLNEHAKEKLNAQAADLLVAAPYAPENSELFAAENIENLRGFCRNWIGANL